MANSVIPATAEPATRAVPDSRGSFPSAGGDIFARDVKGTFEVFCVMKRCRKSDVKRSDGARGDGQEGGMN
jgi:hypothetical protein